MLSVDLTQKPDLKQSLTLEQRQSLAVLLMGNQELEQHLKTQLLDNPFLEEAYPAGAIAEDVPEHEHELDSDIKDSLAPELDFLGHAAIEGCQAHLLTLADRLAAQLGEMAQNDRMKRAGLAIIGMLDDDGFFRCDADWLEEKLGWPKGLAERALALVQSLDPPGIAARDLEECLRLQLEKKLADAGDDTSRIMLENALKLAGSLEDLARGKYAKVGKSLGMAADEAKAGFELIKTLNPKPGSGFATSREPTGYVWPELEIIGSASGAQVICHDEDLPTLVLSHECAGLLRKANDPGTQRYLAEKKKEALSLISALKRRKRTLLQIAFAILAKQPELAAGGIDCIKPMRLKDIAADIGAHESTVSRAANGKYICVAGKCVELKSLFTPSSGGGESSSMGVKQSIRELVSGENPQKPLSDQKITEILEGCGCAISRRAVAKYRADMGIASASLRKR